MKHIQDLETRQTYRHWSMWALFECPICGKTVEKLKPQGLIAKSCSSKCKAILQSRKAKAKRISALSSNNKPDKRKPIYACDRCSSYIAHKGEPCKRCNDGRAVQVYPVRVCK